ncbi:MAG: hypothetical protein ABUL44_02185, partial [Flavobacterium sp.]
MFSVRLNKYIWIFAILFCASTEVFAQQHPDLPSPGQNLQLATTGSLVIPMDNNTQNIGSSFNLKAYGLI